MKQQKNLSKEASLFKVSNIWNANNLGKNT